MIPVFIGYDSVEPVAWHVLAESIIKHATMPLAFTPLGNETLPRGLWWRERGPHDSTQFSNARFMVPALMGFKGWAIFMDCDMLMTVDIEELWAQRDERYSVMCVKHAHRPKEKTKFLGAEQTDYPFKNWSSLMLINCGHPHAQGLHPGYVNSAPGLDLHAFKWTEQEAIGELEGSWNVLTTGPGALEHPDYRIVGDAECEPQQLPALIHYTRGGPWHCVYDAFASRWLDGLRDLVVGRNPCGGMNWALNKSMNRLAVHTDYMFPTEGGESDGKETLQERQQGQEETPDADVLRKAAGVAFANVSDG